MHMALTIAFLVFVGVVLLLTLHQPSRDIVGDFIDGAFDLKPKPSWVVIGVAAFWALVAIFWLVS